MLTMTPDIYFFLKQYETRVFFLASQGSFGLSFKNDFFFLLVNWYSIVVVVVGTWMLLNEMHIVNGLV